MACVPAINLRASHHELCFLFAALLTTATSLLGAETKPDTAQVLKRGEALMFEEKWTEAVQVFSEVIQSHPKSTIALKQRARAYAKLKQYKEAIADYERVIATNPLDGEASSERDIVRQRLTGERPSEEVEWAQKSAQARTLVNRLRYEKGNAQYETEKAIEAIGEPAVPALIEALRSEDVNRWSPAKSVLRRLGPKVKQAVPDLIEMFKHKMQFYRACSVLEKAGPAARPAIPVLKRIIASDDKDKHSDAAMVLFRTAPADPEILQFLQAALPRSDGVRHGIFLCFGSSSFYDPVPVEAAPLLQALMQYDKYRTGHYGEQLKKKLEELRRRLPADKEGLLYKLSYKARDGEKAQAMAKIHAMGETAVPLLLRGMTDKKFEVRDGAATGFRALGEKGASAVPTLVRLARQQDDIELERTIKALAYIGPPARPAIPLIIQVLRAPGEKRSWSFTNECTKALLAIAPQDAQVLRALAAFLGEDSERSKSVIYAIDSCGKPMPALLPLALRYFAAHRDHESLRIIKRIGIDQDPKTQRTLLGLLPAKPTFDPKSPPWRRNAAQGEYSAAALASWLVSIGVIEDEIVRYAFARLPVIASEQQWQWCGSAVYEVLQTVATREPERIVPYLSAREPSCRTAAAWALRQARSTTARALPKLLRLADDRDPLVRDAAFAALDTIDPGWLEREERLRGRLRQHDQAHGLQAMDPTEADPREMKQLIADLRSSDLGRFHAACARLVDLGPNGALALPALFARFNDAYEDTDYALQKALVAIGKPAVPTLIHLANEPGEKRRFKAINTLGEMQADAREAVPALLRILNSKDRSDAQNALAALGNIRQSPETVIPAMLKVGREWKNGWFLAPDPLSKFGPKAHAALPFLRACLKRAAAGPNPHSFVGRIAKAIAAVEPDAKDLKEIMPELIQLLAQPHTESWARSGLIKALGRIGPPARAAAPVIARHFHGHKPEVRSEAIDAYPRVFGADADKTVPDLFPLLLDENSYISGTARGVLIHIGPAAVAYLTEKQTDPNPKTAAAASQTLAALARSEHEGTLLLSRTHAAVSLRNARFFLKGSLFWNPKDEYTHLRTAHLGSQLARFGRAEEAIPYLHQALTGLTTHMGRLHPSIPRLRWNLARAYELQGKARPGLEQLKHVSRDQEVFARDVFAVSSETARLRYIDMLKTTRSAFLSFCLDTASDLPEARQAALDLLLRRQGLVLESLLTDRRAARLGKDPALARLIKDLAQAKTQFSQLAVRGPGYTPLDQYRQQLRSLRSSIDTLEKKLAQASSTLRAEEVARDMATPALIAALPKNAAFVQFARYREHDITAPVGTPSWWLWQYAALVLPPGEAQPVIVKLGRAQTIEARVREYRNAIHALARSLDQATPALEKAVMDASANLRQQVWDPVAKALGEARRVFLCPDAELYFVAFGGLPQDNGRYLLEDYDLTTVSTGRDLVRQPLAAKTQGMVAFGHPSFNSQATRQEELAFTRGTYRSQLGTRAMFSRVPQFSALPGTAIEIEQVARLARNAGWPCAVHVGAAATETQLKATVRPQALYLATHGFFLPESGLVRLRAGSLSVERTAVQIANQDKATAPAERNPMLRSGLVLAGANQTLKGEAPKKGDDGIVTAEEVAGLDLEGTKLVVLSACETGLGEARGGEGVLGLRRAFAMAGAEHLVMSLWPVSDQATQELMSEFFARYLKSGQPGKALREAQRAFLKKARADGTHESPFYWAAFVQSGIGVE